MIIANVGLGDLLWTLLVVFFMVMYFLIMFQVIIDVFRRDASGVNKALWLVFILVAPVIALILYMITNGANMAQRQAKDAVRQEEAARTYIRDAAGTGGPASELAKAKELHAQGVIDDAEYGRLKARILGS